MVGSEVRIRTEAPGEPRPLDGQGEAVLFVAAVAAALVEHRRLSGRAHPLAETESSRANWRMVGRLEQLRGRA
jgi:RNase adaptor protein for sRNA GlmZ degradation